ncbi:GntR family transcriptional regulator [Halalkalibacterium halodurans]|uniref:GntR family transcriptional regulator n=1 Tax=Halalkalibacterium halodurans TaxID=86665 RepID=UPI0010681D65|nr:GntR family transcriptional regulator [Halalkalibacterium halodurans]MED3646229.1 GntR family transcriptional regulator [Halalkalibacterium halodurans]TES56850.1 GntR family transcriptional regulator [Halalkalibacterium halodurans]
MIKVDHRPLYLQVIDKLKHDMESGVYEEGEKLPSEFELSKQLGVSRATLREALRLLEEEGVVVRRHGVGTFVHTKPLFSAGIEELYSVTDMIRHADMEPGTIFLSSYQIEATDDDKRRFQTDNLDQLMMIERVRTADGVPIVYCLDKLPAELIGQHSVHEINSILDHLESGSDRMITHAVTTIEPIGFHEKVSEILECEAETGLLLLKQMHYDQYDTPVLYSYNYFRADKFTFHVVRKRVKA